MRTLWMILIIGPIFQTEPLRAQAVESVAAERADWAQEVEEESFSFGFLQAYDRYFDQTVRFGFSFMRYQPRGYGARYRTIRMGGVALTDWYRGAPAWEVVSGLTDAGESLYDAAQESLPAAGVGEERRVEAWQQNRGGKVSLSAANRNYLLRGTAGYRSGENDRNGWSYSLFAGRTWGRSATVDGVWTDSWALFGSVSKRFGDRHRIGLTAWYAPSRRALPAASTAEAFELAGSNLYNPAWGRWNDTERSIRVSETRQPVAMLTHEYDTGEAFALTTQLAVRLGMESFSGLDWQNADNPHPDYYRYMPSFQPDGEERDRVAELWRTSERVRQIDWERLVGTNRNDPAGRAHYILASRVRDYREFAFRSTARWRWEERTTLRAGIELFGAENLNYKRLDDLLGGNYWLDVDCFVEDPEDTENGTQNDMHYPNRQVVEGESFGYKYSLQAFLPRVWGRFDTQFRAWDFAVSGAFGMASYRRFGYYDKENFPGSESFGWSSWLRRAEWFVRGSAACRIGSRFRAGFRFTAQQLAPTPEGAFISPEYRNAWVPQLRNERFLEAELRLDCRTPQFRAYAGVFAASIRNRTEVHRFYDDLNHFFGNYWMSGIDTRHIGLEFSAEVQLGRQLWLRAAGAWADNRYTANPTAVEVRESTGEPVGREEVYYRSLHVAAGPQAIGVVELTYTPRSWIASVSLNGFAANYITPAPLRRTERALRQMDYNLAVGQENLGAGATVDLFLGKMFRAGEHRFGIYAGIDNLLNRRNIRTSGYESSRIRRRGEGYYVPLASKYYYARGINGFLTATWRF